MPSIEQRLARLEVRVNELRYWTDRAHIPLDRWEFNGRPLSTGDPWPTRDGIATFTHPPAAVPDDWPLDRVFLDLDPGGEGLVRIRYAGNCTQQFGLDPSHRRFPIRGRSFSVEAQSVARLPFGVPNRRARLVWACITLTDPPVERLVRQLELIIETGRVLACHEVAEPLIACAERALSALDWPSATWPYLSRIASSAPMLQIWEQPAGLDPHPAGLDRPEEESVILATEQIEQDLTALRGRYPQQGSVSLSGHAHIDLAWLWPLEETRRKAQRTFSTAVDLMDRYPDLRFNQSTAQLYAFIEEDDPPLFAAIRDKIASGQWEPVGGSWVEPDLNMPAGESLVRQLLYGQRYFRDKLGCAATVFWVPDCFGFTAALPQLLRGAGIEGFFTIKLNWSETNKFPYDLCYWEGLDGSRVVAHLFDNPSKPILRIEGESLTTGPLGDIAIHPYRHEGMTSGYNADVGPFSIIKTWQNYRGKYDFAESLLSFGYGDGGGGIMAEMLERARELAHFPALPSLAYTYVRDYYDRLRATVADHDLPVWVGELYLELHRGTLTTQGRTKYAHRRAERALIAAEVVTALNVLAGTGTVGDRPPRPASLEPLWRILLRNQFHDILPGSSIREVYDRAEAELTGVVDEANRIIASELVQLAGRLAPVGDQSALVVVNPDLSPRPLRLHLEGEFPGSQAVESGHVVSASQTVPGLGARIVTSVAADGELDVELNRIENRFVRVTLAENGTLASVYDKRADREALEGPGNQLWAHVDKPRAWDAWDIDASYPDAGVEIESLESRAVIERGPHRAAIRIERRFRDSTITQDIRLWSNSARIEFRTTLDWHDRHWLLKARFPLAVRSMSATFETAFGVVERPTHRNTSWEAAKFEVAGHRFADLSEPGYGVALLNDGKYGHDVIGNELGLSLLRSPSYPDPLADEGVQTFTYALFPHRGSWVEGGVLMEAEDLNQPLLVCPANVRVPYASGAESVAGWQPVRLEGLPLGLGTLKVPEDGDSEARPSLILRTYEPQGGRGTAQLGLPEGWSPASELDLLENDIGAPDLRFTPFKVHSWRLTY